MNTIGNSLEPLEKRIAPARFISPFVVVYDEADGDRVRVESDKPIFDHALHGFTFTTTGEGERLDLLKLGANAAGARVAIYVQGSHSTGDGLAEIGMIRAGGIDLQSVNVAGSLDRIVVGDSDLSTPAIDRLTVGALGRIPEPSDAAGADMSVLRGGARQIDVRGDVGNAFLKIQGSVDEITIGGSLLGETDVRSGSISAYEIGSIHIHGDVLGGVGTRSGSITAGVIESVVIDGSLVGGAGEASGRIFGSSHLGSVHIRHDVVGGSARDLDRDLPAFGGSGVIASGGVIDSLRIDGSLIGGTGDRAGTVSAAALQAVQIGGSILGGTGGLAGAVVGGTVGKVHVGGDVVGANNHTEFEIPSDDAAGMIASSKGDIGRIVIEGSLRGSGTSQFDGTPGVIFAASSIRSLFIGGDAGGGGGFLIRANDTVVSATIHGDLGGGGITAPHVGSVKVDGTMSGDIYGNRSVDRVVIGGDLLDGAIFAGRRLESVVVNGSMIGVTRHGSILVESEHGAARIGRIDIHGDLVGGADERSGLIDSTGIIDTCVIRGSIIGGEGERSARIEASGYVSSLYVGGDVRGGSGVQSASIFGAPFRQVQIDGSLLGGSGSASGFIDLGDKAGTLTVGGDFRGGDGESSGLIQAGPFQKIHIGGSMSGGSGSNSGRMTVSDGKIVIEGSIENVNDGSGRISAYQLDQLLVYGSVSTAKMSQGDEGHTSNAVEVSTLLKQFNVAGSLSGDAGNRLGIVTGVTSSPRIASSGIGSLQIGGSVSYADITAGTGEFFGLRYLNPKASMGQVTVGGSWRASSLAVAVSPGGDGYFGTDDDTLASGPDKVIARIGSVIIGGRVQGTDEPGDFFAFTAGKIGAFSVAGREFPLGPDLGSYYLQLAPETSDVALRIFAQSSGTI